MRSMTTPVQTQFGDAWWADAGEEQEEGCPGGLALCTLIVLLASAPGFGVLLTLLLD